MMTEITLKLEKSYAERMSMMEFVHKVEMDKIRYETARVGEATTRLQSEIDKLNTFLGWKLSWA